MLNEDDVKKIASLAKLELSAQEKKAMAADLAKILKFVEQLDQLDLAGVKPTAHAVSVTNVFREDQVVPEPLLEKALQAAPECDGRFFQVPKII